MKKGFKRFASFILAVVLVFVMAAPAFACEEDTKKKVTIDVVFDNDSSWEELREYVKVSLLKYGGDAGEPDDSSYISDNTRRLTWYFDDECDVCCSDQFTIKCEAPGCYVIETGDVKPDCDCAWLGTSGEEVSSDEVVSDEEVYFEEELAEEEIPEDFEGCIVPASCEESHLVDCDKCGEKYDCSKRHLCSCKYGFRVCEDCFEIFDLLKKHICYKKTCPDCHKKYDCRKKHECHPCPPCPPIPRYECYYGKVKATLLMEQLEVVNNVIESGEHTDKEFYFNVVIGYQIDSEKVVFKNETTSLSDYTIRPDQRYLTKGPVDASFKVKETTQDGYTVTPAAEISGVLTESVQVEFTNYKGSIPPRPTPTPGGGGSGSGTSVILTETPAEQAPQGPVVEAAPKTGMPMEYYVWLVTIVLSIGAAAVVLFKRNKKAA